MILTRKLVLALYLVLLHINYSNAQDILTTNNLINTGSWTGVRYTDNAGVSNCCSGGPNPAYNVDTNTIRFSWGLMPAAQSIGINKAFESIGTGIKVTGYNYSWMINNADYNSGPLSANVRLVGANGNILESYNYDYSRYIPDFETFKGTQKFTVDYGVPSLNSLDVSFIGSDNRFWAGYYGPRVRNVNLSLNYAFDTSKPTAPTTLPTVVTNVDTLSNTAESTGVNSSTIGLPQEVINGTAPDVLANPTTTSTASSQTSAPIVVAPAVEIIKESNTTRTTSNWPSALAMSVVQKNKEAVKAIEAQAVQRVQEQIASEAKLTQQQTQLAIDTTQQSIQTNTFQISLTTNTGTGLTLSRQNFGFQAAQLQQLQNTSLMSSQTFGAQELKQEQHIQDTPQLPQQLTNARTDPVKALTEPVFSIDSIPQETKLEALKSNIAESELSAGVSIASIAIIPNGYSSYTNYQLLDAKFYSVKPIYENQRVIDNARVLRGLGSDQKHKQMVQDQYR